MIEHAFLHSEKLIPLYNSEIVKPRAIYYQTGCREFMLSINNSSYYDEDFVSISEGKIQGYLTAKIDLQTNSVSNMGIIGFEGRKPAKFMDDVYTFVGYLLSKYAKIKFCVCIGNPAEKTWDIMVEHFDGHIVGIFKNDVLLVDGRICDHKYYEILSNICKLT